MAPKTATRGGRSSPPVGDENAHLRGVFCITFWAPFRCPFPTLAWLNQGPPWVTRMGIWGCILYNVLGAFWAPIATTHGGRSRSPTGDENGRPKGIFRTAFWAPIVTTHGGRSRPRGWQEWAPGGAFVPLVVWAYFGHPFQPTKGLIKFPVADGSWRPGGAFPVLFWVPFWHPFLPTAGADQGSCS